MKSIGSKLMPILRAPRRATSVFLYGMVTAQPRITNGILAIAYARSFTLGEYGIYGVLGALVAIGVFADLGLPMAVVRNYYDWHHDKSAARAYLSSIIGGALLLFLLTIPVVAIILCLLWDFVGISNSLIWYLVPLLAGITFFDRTTDMLAAVCQAVEKPQYFAAGKCVQSAVTVIAGIAIVYGLHGGVVGAMAGFLVGRIASSVAYQLMLLRGLGLKLRRPNWPQLRACLVFGLPFVPNRVAIWLRQPALRPILAYLVPMQAVGLFSLAGSIAIMPMILSAAVDLAITPLYFKRRTSGETGFREKMVTFGKLYMACLFPIWAFSIAFNSEIIRLVGGSTFMAAVPTCAVLLCASFARSQHPFLMRQIEFLRKTWLMPMITGASAALTLALALLLGHRYGILAVAGAVAVSDVLILLGLAWAVKRQENLGYSLAMMFGFLAAFVIVTVWIIHGQPAFGGLPPLAIKVAIFASSVIVSGTFWIWPNRKFIQQLARS